MKSNSIITDNTDSFISVLITSLYSHQTWSSFFGSLSSSMGMLFLNHMANSYINDNEKLRKEETARKEIGDAFNEATLLLEKRYHFSDAKSILELAISNFDKYFINCLETDTYYQNFYVNLACMHVTSKIYLGEIDSAFSDISNFLEKYPHINFRKSDLKNLLGIVKLKMEKYEDAEDSFLSSLEIFPNQPIIIQLRWHCFLKKSEKNLHPDKLTNKQAISFLSSSMLFQTTSIDPYSFEINMAHIDALIQTNAYQNALEKLKAIEEQYATITFSLQDQKKLYQLFISVLSRLKEAAPTDEELKEKYKNQPQNDLMNEFLLNKKNPYTMEKLENLEYLYRIKLRALPDIKSNPEKNCSNKKNSEKIKAATQPVVIESREDKVSLAGNRSILFPMAIAGVIGVASVAGIGGNKLFYK